MITMQRPIRLFAAILLLASCATGSPATVAVASAGSTTTVAPPMSTPTTTPVVSTTTTLVSTTTVPEPSTTAATVAPTLPSQPPDSIADAGPTIIDEGPGIGRIEIPRLGVDQRLQDGWDLPILDNGPGLMPGSPRPGEIGNMVVAGHRTSKTRPFRYIDTLELGDEVIFTFGGARYIYTVTEHLIVNPDAIWITDPTATATATMFACHPPGSTAQRWVTRLVLVAGP